MRLLEPLMLIEASTTGVDLTPTKSFFKPVLVISAPVEKGNTADLLGIDYLFTENGKPYLFEGTHKLSGELPGAGLVLKSKHHEMELDAEKVCHFAVSIEEKKALRVQVRIHLPEGRDMLYKLLDFLADLNKDPFTVTITDRQASLLGKGKLEVTSDPLEMGDKDHEWPVAKKNGEYPDKRATSFPFSSTNGAIVLFVLQVEDDKFAWGYSIAWRGSSVGSAKLHFDRHTDSSVHAKEEAALAAWHIWIALPPKGVKQIADHEAGKAFLIDARPELARPVQPDQGPFLLQKEDVH